MNVDIAKRQKRTIFLFRLNLALAAFNTMLMLIFATVSFQLTVIFGVTMLLNIVTASIYATLINYEEDKLK